MNTTQRIGSGTNLQPHPKSIRRAALVVFTFFMAAICSTTAAQEKNPFAGDPKEAKLGEFQFRANCAFCHGLGAKGGGRGPDLTRVQKKHGNADADLFRTINEGVPGTAMPPNGATQQGVGMTPDEIWQVITYIRSVEVRNAAAIAGNPTHGKELFYGSAGCSTCHMIAGKGGRLAPELTAAGAGRSIGYLKESVREPNKRLAEGISEAMKEFSQEYETVSVVTLDGKSFQGVVLNEDSFTVQMMDVREQLHSFDKSQLKSFQKTRTSLMPVYDTATLSEKDLDDLVSFLLKVSTEPGGAK